MQVDGLRVTAILNIIQTRKHSLEVTTSLAACYLLVSNSGLLFNHGQLVLTRNLPAHTVMCVVQSGGSMNTDDQSL